MKLWFVEPKPNVFVSGVRDSVAKTVTDLLLEHCSPSSGLIIFRSQETAPGYEILTLGAPKRQLTQISGLQLVLSNL